MAPLLPQYSISLAAACYTRSRQPFVSGGLRLISLTRLRCEAWGWSSPRCSSASQHWMEPVGGIVADLHQEPPLPLTMASSKVITVWSAIFFDSVYILWHLPGFMSYFLMHDPCNNLQLSLPPPILFRPSLLRASRQRRQGKKSINNFLKFTVHPNIRLSIFFFLAYLYQGHQWQQAEQRRCPVSQKPPPALLRESEGASRSAEEEAVMSPASMVLPDGLRQGCLHHLS